MLVRGEPGPTRIEVRCEGRRQFKRRNLNFPLLFCVQELLPPSRKGSLMPQKIKMIVLAGASPHEAW